MSKIYLSSRDYVVDATALVRLGFVDIDSVSASVQAGQPRTDALAGESGENKIMGYTVSPSDRVDFDRKRALERLKGDPDLGALFLGLTGGMDGNGTVYWTGANAGLQLEDGSFGVRIAQRREGDEVLGDNRFGDFLTDLRDDYREYLRTAVLEEVRPVDPSMVVSDFTPPGAFESDIERRERAGEEFIHTDVYRPARFRFDTGLDGTTGHAGRSSSEEVPFQRFDCPFGTGYPSPLVVGSAAEASMLYERAIRGELDWRSVIRSLSESGGINKNLTERQKENMAQQYDAQFRWMRERIATDPSLRDRPVVTASRLVGDDSMGRSVYDPVAAPSPADVLRHYIENPVLLYAQSKSYVVSALQEEAKDEPQRFSVDGTKVKELRILVIGSDTIGGREPGGKGYSDLVREVKRDAEGRRIVTASKAYRVPFKSKEEVERDYEAFRTRMDQVLSDVPADVSIRLVTGSSSTMGASVGVGTPKMVERYVKELGGRVSGWDYSRHRAEPQQKDGKVENERLSAIVMEHFAEAAPVLVGRSQEVRFLLDRNDQESEVGLSVKDGLRAGAALCFSAEGDSNNRNVFSLASYAADAGLPLVHVREVRSEQVQMERLRSGALLSLSSLTGEVEVGGEALWGPGIEARSQWALDAASSNVLSFIDREQTYALPIVSESFPAGVSVAGYTFNTAYSVYAALLAQEMGKADGEVLNSFRKAEGYVVRMDEAIAKAVGRDIPGEVQERCLRRSVRLMAEANEGFADRLLSLDARSVVIPVAEGDRTLFTDLNGEGLNRFGMVLEAEGGLMRQVREARRVKEEEERMKVLEEANRKQKVLDARSAEGQKVATGLPATPEGAKGAVWFIGTHTPDHLSLPDGQVSFDMWDDMGGEDRLVRAKAVAQRVDDGEGGKLDNNYVFLFPSDLASVTGRFRTSPRSDSPNLTGCERVDPKDGKKFTCAFGVPVRFNNRGFELMNKDGMPCSYRLDNDAANFARSVVLADSQARVQAYNHGMTLCLPGRVRSNGEDYYTLGQVFMDKTWTKKDGWSDNPHRAPLNLDITERYISLLERGRSYPLTMIPMPKVYYRPDDPEGARERVESEGRNYVSAEGRFLADLNLSLRIANATALALGVPMRFPLDKDGRIDLGPGVPEEFRKVAERKIDAFIGVQKELSVVEGRLPLLEAVPTAQAIGLRASMELRKAGDIYLRPNDLVPAFGQYDFDGLVNGGFVPLHEMTFRMENGSGYDVFYVHDAQTNRGKPLSEINKYLSYEKNDLRRFVVRTNNPDRLPEFTAVLKEYVARANAITVDTPRLVQEREAGAKDLPMDGFVNLLDSNSEEFAKSEHDIGREATVHNAIGRVNKEGAVEDRNVSGDKNSGVYFGRSDAKDGFAGFAQIRFSYDGAPMSGWHTVQDLELAKDIVMSLVGRKYAAMDQREVPSAKTLELFMKAEAMKHLVAEGGYGLSEGSILEKAPGRRRVQEADDKVVVLEEPVKERVPDRGASRIGTGAETEEEEWFVSLKGDDKLRAFTYFTSGIYAGDAFVKEDLDAMGKAVEAYRSGAGESPLYEVYELFSDEQKHILMTEVSLSLDSASEVAKNDLDLKKGSVSDIVFTCSSGGYQQRTSENANAQDVDFTLAFAVDFTTYGERATAKAAGDSIVQVDFPLSDKGGLDLSAKGVQKAVKEVFESLPEEFFKGESCGLNIAGNGLYTLSSKGVTQEQCDEFVTRVLDGLQKKGMQISSVRSGGQSGVDESGAVAGVVLGIPTTVHTTKDWAFHGTDNRDRRGEEAFKARFAGKNYDSLKAAVSQAKGTRRKVGQKGGQSL